MKKRVMIVEDQTMFLQLMKGVLQLNPLLDVVAAVQSITEAKEVLPKIEADLMILDLTLPDGRGIDLLRSAVERFPKLQTLVVSGEAMSFVCPADMKQNIRAVIDKTEAYDQLRLEIDEFLIDPNPGDQDHKIANRNRRVSIDPFDELTRRQKEIFQLVGTGIQNKEIAQKLSISHHTVHAHRKAISKTLGKSGSDLVHFASVHHLRNLGS